MKCGFSVTVSLDRFEIHGLSRIVTLLILYVELEQGGNIYIINSVYPKNVYIAVCCENV